MRSELFAHFSFLTLHSSPLMFGLLNINKPAGMTSHDVVGKVRRIVKQKQVGHAGTLDPMATGVLLVCVGQATRLIEYLTHASKTYCATIRFGITTNTLDAEGEITSQQDATALTEAQLRAVLPCFIGQLDQVPPIFSAIKQGGQPLYKQARAGKSVEVAPRPITIHGLTWRDWQWPDLTLEVTCSAGTYIRSLARDLGEAVGVGAHLAALTRTVSGQWSLAESVSLAQLGSEVEWQKYLHPIHEMLAHLPSVYLSNAEAMLVRYGQQIHLDPLIKESHNLVCTYTLAGDFLAILTLADPAQNLWQPKKVMPY